MIFDLEHEFSAMVMQSIDETADGKGIHDDQQRAKEEARQRIRESIWVATTERLIEPLLTELCGREITLVPGQNCQVGYRSDFSDV